MSLVRESPTRMHSSLVTPDNRALFEELGIAHVKPEEVNADYQRELGNVFFYMDTPNLFIS